MRTVLCTAVPLGLLAAWLANDTEEWFTIGPWSRRNAASGSAGPRLGPQWLRAGVSDRHAHVAIGLMGALMAAAAAAGVRSGGRSRLFQSAVAGFGLHGLGHLALSAAYRGYTPGVATAPTVVLPYALWAWRELGRAGVRGSGWQAVAGAALLLPVALGGVHAAARGLAGPPH